LFFFFFFFFFYDIDFCVEVIKMKGKISSLNEKKT